MIVQFSASESDIKSNIGYFRQIAEAIKEEGCEFSIDWIEEAYQASQEIVKTGEDKRDWVAIHKSIIDGLKRADLCIFEASTKSFAVGFQTALALQMQKPILVLTRNQSLRDTFGAGIVSDLLTYKAYTKDSIGTIVGEFIKSNNLHLQDLRFNFVIDREIHNYLRWAAFYANTTRAEIVRRALRAKISETNGQ